MLEIKCQHFTYKQGRRNRWSNCFTGIQSFYYRQILSILHIWREKFFMLHWKKTRSNAPEFLKFRLLLVLAIKLLLGNFYGLMNLLGIKYDHLRCLFQSRISIISKFKCWREIAWSLVQNMLPLIKRQY